MTRREQIAGIISRVLKENAGQPETVLKKALRDAYPFGERANHPYKIWCDEIRRQRGLPRAPSKHQREERAVAAQSLSLFEEGP